MAPRTCCSLVVITALSVLACSRMREERDAPSGLVGSTHADSLPPTCAAVPLPDGLKRPGQVVLEFVIDTLGQAERSSVRIISSRDRAAEAWAREVVLGCHFHPGRVAGQAVRVRVRHRYVY